MAERPAVFTVAPWGYRVLVPSVVHAMGFRNVVRGFKIAVSREKDDREDSFAIVHGTKFVLVDSKRQIRGYYDASDSASMSNLRDHLAALADGSAR